MKSLIGLLVLAFTLTAMPAFAETQASAEAAKYGLNLASPGQMAKQRLGSRVTYGMVHVLRGKYDFAVQGGAVGAKTLLNDVGQPAVLPKGAIVVDCIIDVITAGTTSASGTMALSTGQGAADLKAALAAASYTGRVACIPVGTAATAIKLTADRTMTGTIATGALTAGKWYVVIQYILSE